MIELSIFIVGLIAGWVACNRYNEAIYSIEQSKREKKKAEENLNKLYESEKAIKEQIKKAKPVKKSYHPAIDESKVKFWD